MRKHFRGVKKLRAHSHRRSGEIRFEALESRHLLSATAQLLADINTQSSSSPGDLIEFQDRLYYDARHADYGREIWSTDGTDSGTQLLVDLVPGVGGISPSNFIVSGDYLYFSASVGSTGEELWRTDGTAAGTLMLRDINPGSWGSLSIFSDFVDVGGTLFFTADNGTGQGIWKTDGTTAGTVLVKAMGSSPFSTSDLIAVGNTLYFLATDSAHGEELWRSDGTAAGTVMVKDIRPGTQRSWISEMIAYQGELYFEANDGAGDALWKSNGTSAGTQKVSLPAGLSYYGDGLVVGDWLYFTGSTSAHGIELWRTDGSLAGTTLVADLAPGSASSSPRNFMNVDGTLYFVATINSELQLFATSGAASGVVPLASLDKFGESPYFDGFGGHNGVLYFIANSSLFGADLWRSDGTPLGTFSLQGGIAPAGSSLELLVAADRVFFTANIAGSGLELWQTSGGSGGLSRIPDGASPGTDSSSPRVFVTAGDHVFFKANDGRGEQLWASNGEPGHAIQLTPSYYGVQSSRVEELTASGGLLYFAAYDAQGQRYLGVSNGTPQGTRKLAWPAGISNAEVFGVTAMADGVIFTARDVSQGFVVMHATSQSIEVVAALGTAWGLPSPSLYEGHGKPALWNGQYFFLAYGPAGYDVWRSDGTEQGTYALRSVAPHIGNSLDSLTVTDSGVYFIARNSDASGSYGLYRTDGTAEGTWHVPDAFAEKLIGAGDKLFFTREPVSFGDTELWVTDGTAEGTLPLTTIFDEHLGGVNSHLKAVVLGDQLYFFGETSNPFGSYTSLWRSDGTPEGTIRVDDRQFYAPRVDIAVVDGRLLFSDVSSLYLSDGTAEGTEVFSGITLPTTFPLSESITALDGKFFFPGASGDVGLEPHFLKYKPASIVGRHLFYNQSKFDNGSPGLIDADDNAIAPDKTPYFPGSGTATFDNISSYVRGINGVMIDFADLPPASTPVSLSLDDFVFRIGSNNDLGTWTTAPAPIEWSFRYPTGDPEGLTRISFRWANNAIANTWLEITVLANERTGLEKPDVFYFGNRIGDTGSGSPTAAITSAADELAVRNDPRPQRPITSLLDFDRNSITNAADALIARNNGGVLLKLNLPIKTAAGPLVAAPLFGAEDDAESFDVIAAPVAESLVAAPAAEQQSTRGSLRSDLLAFALQRWSDLLDSQDEDDDLLGVRMSRGRG